MSITKNPYDSKNINDPKERVSFDLANEYLRIKQEELDKAKPFNIQEMQEIVNIGWK